MMNTKKRMLSTLLICAMLTASFASCSESKTNTDETSNTGSAEPGVSEVVETEAETEPEFLPDELPADLDFEGETVNIFCWDSWDPGELFVEEDNGEIAVSAVFNRNLTVEDRLNVKLVFDERERNSAAYGSALKDAVSNQNASGDAAYDMVSCYGMRVASLAVEGALTNLYDTPYIDLEKPWYYESATEAGTLLKDHAYLFAGDISFNALARMSGVYFNRGTITDYNLEDPYTLVLEGTWTIDKMSEMITGLYLDVNSDGKQSDGDQYGLMIAGDQMQTLYYGTGSHFIEHDENGSPILSEDVSSERTLTILEKYLSLFEKQDAYKNPSGDDPTIFDTGRTLFYIYPLGHVSDPSLRESEVDYGFIPQPKVEESDENYHASVTNAVSLFAIPLVVKSLDLSSAVAECMSSEGHRQVTPVIFEQAYKVKYNQDESQRQSVIFDMLRENAVFDLGKIFADTFAGFSNGVIGDTIWSGNNTYSSRLKGFTRSFNKSIEKLTKNLNLEP